QGDRWKAYEAAKAALALTPAPDNGHDVFVKHCATCHRFNREGVAVGPDLFDIRRQEKESILLHIVIPEYEIVPNFTTYICETRDGRSITGILTGENSSAVTLRQAQGLEENIPRGQIVSLTPSRLSLMPQEFERTVS